MRKFLCIIIFSVMLVAKDDWGYGVDESKNWGNISELYLGCKFGKQQSPINISPKHVSPGAQSFTLKYLPAKGVNLRLDNHTFKITYPKGSYIEMAGTRYILQEIHFKTPAETIINSQARPLEAQFYHEDSKGRMLIMSVIFDEGRANPLIERLNKSLPKESNKSIFITNVDANELVPKSLESYQFYGSITYPPCTQDVYWIVLKNHMRIMQIEADAMREITGENARETQDIADRLIMEN
ncbi:carbonic anhydrase [Helicobacter saguini]|uniref:carbonic anhydrase n=1 Tax=Helicobacter saguini TaxID=1548018 RepID=A0A347VPX9_9HELI|nr:carbonic anhydrase family protein [Helicobacter saguini]MWV61166.1 carbonic anhydrase [Helicobacter saguini]MWV68167.1 carbonic anhydrase [Helicobacter saguini]MWV70370.1 carbonic anhydrase [Helicobacter saguini]MWV72271.1 carbonic anhydrase [Helicobacter saguini]TLD95313.1 carbonic anhydrase [Helicobacter saguini]